MIFRIEILFLLIRQQKKESHILLLLLLPYGTSLFGNGGEISLCEK